MGMDFGTVAGIAFHGHHDHEGEAEEEEEEEEDEEEEEARRRLGPAGAVLEAPELVGSLAYLAPELLRGEPHSTASDVSTRTQTCISAYSIDYTWSWSVFQSCGLRSAVM